MKNPQNLRAVVLFCLLLLGCANQGPPITTASGRPEVVIPGVSPKRVRAAMIDRAMAHGWTLEHETENGLSFTKQSDNVAASILLGSTYDPNVIDRVRITTVALDAGTKVYATEELVSNHGSAFERITPLHNNNNSRNLQSVLESLKSNLVTKGE
jgi:hypothetical protein